jgi:hypothetical protein
MLYNTFQGVFSVEKINRWLSEVQKQRGAVDERERAR